MSDYLRFFSQAEAEAIVAAIAEVEMRTSGELRLHVENKCKGEPMSRALHVFEHLGMHATRERNAVLFYLSTVDRKFAILGDEGIHEKVGAAYWDIMKDAMEAKFRAGQVTEGIIAAIRQCGESLVAFFPRREDDTDELPNTISTASI